MLYPTTVRYSETILNPDGLFRTLTGLSSPVPPEFSSGAYGAVFRVTVAGKPCALKCFTRHQPGRAEAYRRIARALEPLRKQQIPYLVPFRWLEDEITVFGDDGSVSEQSVLLMDWVEGRSLTQAIHAAAADSDRRTLLRLSEEFDRLAVWLLRQPFAHGDLKPDNIMVRPDGQLVLIDYDGLYLPEMAGERARETGTEGFRHPGRSETGFGKQIDDFPIALISLGLRALARWPELYERFCNRAALLFDPARLAKGECPGYNYLHDTELSKDPLFAMLGSGDERLEGLAQALAREPAGILSFDYCGEPGAEGIRLVRRAGKYGFMTAGGSVVAECVFDRAREFSEGAAAVCVGGRWGFIGPAGEWLREPQYEDCGDFSEGLVPICIGGKWGFADGAFRLLSRPRFDDAWPFAEGRALVRKGSRYGYAGPDGRLAIPVRYDFAQGFSEGAACVMMQGLYGYIDRRGRWLVEPQFDYARSKHGGRAYAERDGKGCEVDL
ncbi:WG repeat-containing protein [uncultured Rikenella sp.]|uniref:WG repeat-containing protein n=1 Tax=uncultured Rikenella sp. TaxID=368003 RepID=UPI0026105567|nr:WG repeat-containing protein [uncultured Rikenella sp.]